MRTASVPTASARAEPYRESALQPGRHPMRSHLHSPRSSILQQRLLALFALALLLLNFPLLALWDRDVLLWGLPLFPVALFIIWGLLIAALAGLMERSE